MRPKQTQTQKEDRPVSKEEALCCDKKNREEASPAENKQPLQTDRSLFKIFIYCFLLLFAILGELNAQLSPDLCWMIADGDDDDGSDGRDSVYTFNHVTGVVQFVGATGTYSIESMAIDPINEIIYAVSGDAFGTVDPTTGVFTEILADIGDVDGAEGTIDIDDVDGLTYDITNNILWGSERRDDSSLSGVYLPNDLLFQIDPATGQPIQDAFGPGVDYLVIITNENDLDDIAMANDGRLFAISNQGGSGNQRLGTIDTSTGAWTEIGDYGVADVEGLAFTSLGQLIATTGKSGANENSFYSIDSTTAQANFINTIGVARDVEACACLTGNFVNSIIRGVVWSDSNSDGIRDAGESGIASVSMNLLYTDGTPVLDDLGSPITALTDANGNYEFNKLSADTYRVSLSLPALMQLSPMGATLNTSIDSDFEVTTGQTVPLALVTGQIIENIDAGLKIEEICNNGVDDDGDGLTDCDDPDCGTVTVDVGTDVNNCAGTAVQIGASVFGAVGAVNYAWSNGNTNQSQVVNPAATTTFSVTVTIPSGCTATDQMTVNVVACPEDCTNGVDDDGDGLIDCNDPDCAATATPILMDDSYATCPGMPYSDRVTYNDNNLQNPAFSISSSPTHGLVTIDATGKFTYTPFSNDCIADQFIYEVCNLASGCCAQATVTISMDDTTPPILTNVPADITIGCDDAVPEAETIIAFDECPGIYIDFEETSDQNYAGSCEAYTITRTWIATDLCGNSASGTQTISVVDQTKPEIFQVYTLESGQRVVAGVAKRVTHDWKYVPFPITFNGTPMIFSTVISENDPSAVTVRHRNPYSQGFEVGLFEEENNDGVHAPEDVAWIAIEAGTNVGDLVLEADRWQYISEAPQIVNFTGYFGSNPGLLTSIQSTHDDDPAKERISAITDTTAIVFVQEEVSADAEIAHALEHISYLAFVPGVDLTDNRQQVFGETGKINLSDTWTTVSLNGNYTKPVVVFGGITNNETDGVNVRIRNLTANSFEVRLQEWDYLDGTHAVETVSWIAVEGSIPGNMGYYCSGSVSNLQIGVNVFAIDNCDDQTAFGYNEVPTPTASGMLTTRTWMAIDDCGNTNLITRYDTCSTAALILKAKLHGPTVNNGNSSNMRDDLRLKSFIPLEEPFSSLPGFPHIEDTTPNNDTETSSDTTSNGANQAPLPPGAGTAYYKTIADGNWDDPATWENGNVPLLDDTISVSISIEHVVVIISGSLWMSDDSELYITNGGLHIIDGHLGIFTAKALINNSSIYVSETFSNVKWLTAPYSNLTIKNSDITVGMSFINGGGVRWLENVCLDIGYDLDNSAGRDTMINVTGSIENNFLNNLFGKMHLHDVRFKTVNGDFWNSYSGQVTGDSLLLWAQNGQIVNSGQWNAPVIQYCAAGSVTNLGASLPISEDCAGIPDNFISCTSLLSPSIIGNGGGPTIINTANIALEGTLDPVLLTVEGDAAVVDWMLVEVRDPADESVILDYATVAMLRDGRIISEDGADVIYFPDLIEGNYLVTLRHRNHLPIMTDIPIYLSILNPPLVDFTDPAQPVRGGATGGRIFNGVRTLWGGDYNEDEKVIYQGPNNDVFYLFSRVLSEGQNIDFLANYIIEGYDLHDFNLDGSVIYQGPNNDRASLLYHTVLSHAGNGGFLANYIVKGHLP